MQADRVACLIRHQLGSLKGSERQKAGQELLAKVPAHLRTAVVERLKARAANAGSEEYAGARSTQGRAAQ